MSTARSRSMTARLAASQLGMDARFPRTPGPASPGVALPSAALPIVAPFDPPVQPSSPAPAALPPQGVAAGIEARTIPVTWPEQATILTGAEVTVYTTVKQWPACDVYIQDQNQLAISEVITIRIYAVSAGSPPTLVASGRAGDFGSGAAAAALGGPVWLAAARSQASRFMVTMQVEGSVAAFSGQTTLVTIVGTNLANDPPPLLGSIRIARRVQANQIATHGTAELLMVQGALDAPVSAPRYLHVHEKSGAVNGQIPAYSFPLGDGVGANLAGGGGFGGAWWFPPGVRAQGLPGIFQIVGSSSAGVTAIAADVFVQGLFR